MRLFQLVSTGKMQSSAYNFPIVLGDEVHCTSHESRRYRPYLHDGSAVSCSGLSKGWCPLVTAEYGTKTHSLNSPIHG